MAPQLNSTQSLLPKFTLEDELATLRGLICMAWLGGLCMLLLEIYVRTAERAYWPTLGDFSTAYNLVLTEFMANTLLLTVLLVRGDWYERAPRESVRRLRWLLVAVFLWAGLHYFAAFHVLGSLRSPLMPLLPLLAALGLLLFPGRSGVLASLYIIGGHLVVVLLEQQELIMNPGPLSTVFTPVAMDNTAVATLLLAVLPALWLGSLFRRRLDETGTALYRPARIDPVSGLYNQAFLMQRLQSEINRSRRQGFSCSLLLLELSGLRPDFSTANQMSLRETMQQVGSKIVESIRLSMDTPANPVLSPYVYAVLLPDSGAQEAGTVCNRLLSGIAGITGSVSGKPVARTVILVINNAEHVTAEQVMDTAADALVSSSAAVKVIELPQNENKPVPVA